MPLTHASVYISVKKSEKFTISFLINEMNAVREDCRQIIVYDCGSRQISKQYKLRKKLENIGHLLILNTILQYIKYVYPKMQEVFIFFKFQIFLP